MGSCPGPAPDIFLHQDFNSDLLKTERDYADNVSNGNVGKETSRIVASAQKKPSKYALYHRNISENRVK
jgi:hypothetical protein